VTGRFDVRASGKGYQREYAVVDTTRRNLEVVSFKTPEAARRFADKRNAEWARYAAALSEGRRASVA
jgi:hypothetical protein